MNILNVVIIKAVDFGTRIRPYNNYFSKEMLQIGTK